MVCPPTTASGSLCLAWPGVWATDPAGMSKRRAKGSTAGLAMLGRIFVYQPPRENLRHYAIFRATNRAANVTRCGLRCGLAERRASDSRTAPLQEKAEGCSLFLGSGGHCAVTVIACAALFPSTSHAFACTLCGRRDYGSAKVCIFWSGVRNATCGWSV